MADEDIKKHARELARHHYGKILDDTSLLVQLCGIWHYTNLESLIEDILKKIKTLKT